MKILPPRQEVNLYKEGFGDLDLLERKKVSKALSDLVDRIEDPIVIALDGNWGTGKTHFLQRWVGAHTLENDSKATTVYFDAFSHDYLNDPLPALVSALTDRLPDNNKVKIERVKKAAFKLAKPLARIGLAVATFGATEALNDLGDAAVEAVRDESADALDKYWKEETGRREAMFEFRNALEALAEASLEESDGSSLVFVIDELDRCRPDYALEILEVIKHFFSVPHVHFVLGVNLKSLEKSVQARYGTNTDGHAYLKKFIQITVELPAQLGKIYNTKQTNLVYLRHLIKEMGVPQHLATPLESQLALVSKSNYTSMRDIEKIASSIALASEEILTKSNWFPGWILVFLDLIISKTIRPDLYPKFLNGRVTSDELYSYLGATDLALIEEIGGKYNSEYSREMHWKYLSWLYIAQDTKINDIPPEFLNAIGRQFDDFGLRGNKKSLPMEVNTRWLERFSFYAP